MSIGGTSVAIKHWGRYVWVVYRLENSRSWHVDSSKCSCSGNLRSTQQEIKEAPGHTRMHSTNGAGRQSEVCVEKLIRYLYRAIKEGKHKRLTGCGNQRLGEEEDALGI